jgi:hypothetical protein
MPPGFTHYTQSHRPFPSHLPKSAQALATTILDILAKQAIAGILA